MAGVIEGPAVGEHVGRIFQTLHLPETRAARLLVDESILDGLKNPAFFKAFAGVLVQTAEKIHRTGAGRVCDKLLRWSCILIRENCEIVASKAAFSRIASVQGCLVSAVSLSSWRLRRGSIRCMLQLFLQKPNLADSYVAELQATAGDTDSTNGLIRVLLQLAVKDSSFLGRHRAKFLGMYVSLVWTSKEKVSARLSEAFSPLLSRLTHEEFGNVVQPAVVKMLRRNPEIVMEATCILISSVSLDTSKYAVDFFVPLLPQARHSDESRRKNSAAAVSSLAHLTSDQSVVLSLFQLAKAALGGSDGKLTFPYQRAGIVGLILALSSVEGGETVSPLADAISRDLMLFYKDEGNEDVRLTVLSALGAWLLRVRTGLPKECTIFFATGLKEKENLRRGHLRCILMVMKNADNIVQLQSLTDALVQLVKNGITKPAQRLDCLYALCLSAMIGTQSCKSCELISKEKLWALALQKDSPLLSIAVLPKMNVEDCLVLAPLVEVIVLQYPQILAENPVGSLELFKLLVTLLWHPIYRIREEAHKVVARLQKDSPRWLTIMLDLFCDAVASLEERLSLQKWMDPGDAPPELSSFHPSATVLEKALIAVASPKFEGNSGACAKLLLICHHPFMVRGRRKDVIWQVLVRNWRKRHVNILATLESDPALLCGFLFGSSGLSSSRPSEAQAAVSALATAMQAMPQLLFPHFFHQLKTRVSEELSSLDEKERKDETTPTEIMKVPPASVNQNKKSSGQAKKDTKKPGKNANDVDKLKSLKELTRELQLKEEAAAQLRMRTVQERVSLLLEALTAVAVVNPGYIHDQLPVLVEYVMLLIRSPIVGGKSFEVMVALAGCVPPVLRHFASDIAVALSLTATSSSVIADEFSVSAGSQSEKPGLVHRLILGIASACKDRPLPAPTFSLVFPVMEKVLFLPFRSTVHDELLDIISLHSSSNMSLPILRMILALHQVLGYVPAYKVRIVSMLKALYSRLNPSDLAEALSGVFSEHAHVRTACLSCVKLVPSFAKREVPPDRVVATRIWMALYDQDSKCAEIAEELWDLYPHELGSDYATSLLTPIGHPNLNVRHAAAGAIAAAMDEYISTVPETLSSLFSLYVRDLPIGYGEVDPTWHSRQGVALALHAAADILTDRDLPVVATFLISRALADTNPEVRVRMLDAGVAIIERHGKENVGLLFPIFENYLDTKPVDEIRYDLVREAVVVFMGALATHLSLDDSKMSTFLERLLEVLNTPSEAVQRAVSKCLPSLVPSHHDKAYMLVQKLLSRLLQSEKYAERRGAAFGLAGVVKGLGLPSLKKFGVIDALKVAAEEKNSPKAREGGLLCLECLCESLGRLFEPYMIHVLPLLLVCFSDQVMAVREAADAAARAMMAELSAQGVKLILPALLKGLEDKAWRTKQGSVQLLGAMAFCAPHQLSQCLPTIVPKLSEVLTDTHPKVQSAAQTALQQVGSVIKNPEIAALVPTLLTGIADPNEHTKSSLEVILQTTFVNSVDAPSLALLVPVVHRGLRARGSETKKKAAQIVGNMSTLVTEHKDMLPYLSLLLPEVKKVLVDPIPEVRTVAAQALGSLIRGMGEDNFKDLVPWLLESLKSESSSVERSGAAQGLSEVLAALGTQYFEAVLPDIIQNCSHQRAAVRDGYLTLFKYLPIALGSTFQRYLPQVLPSILDGLADENEAVRDAALSAGHIFVEHYATTSLPLLLPAVEEGIFNENWRIRQSSVELLGDLLFKVAGTSGKVVIDGGSDDEGASTEAHGRAIVDVLGRERRNEVLAAVYMVRSDVSLSVRQAALHVWKTVVSNTPKTLKEIMPVLMNTLISSLASTSSEHRQVGGRSLGELVRKLGDRVLPSIIPILARRLDDEKPSTRQGVCFGLSEVLASAGKHQLVAYMGDLIPTIQTGLCDNSPEVRVAAGLAFSTLFKSAGMQAVDEIVGALLRALEVEETSAAALSGLKQILSVRAAAVLPYILPKLVQTPLTPFNANALGALAEVAGSGINGYLSTVLPPLVAAMSEEEDELASLTKKAAETVVLAVDEEGVEQLIGELGRGLGDPQSFVRRGSAYLTGFLFKNTKFDLEDELSGLLTTLIVMLTDPDASTMHAAWEALASVTGSIPKENLPSYIKVVRDAISTARDKERRRRKVEPILIPGLCLPKALQPILPIFLQGLMSGSAELREQAAEGLGELIDVTNEVTLKPFIVPITGPLIRIVGDRFSWQVKSAILATLGIVITKGGIALKPFLPQLQTTFIKCLQDNSKAVRSRSAWALGQLSALSVRIDPVVGDLLNGLQVSENGVNAMLIALMGVMKNAGKNVSAPVVGNALAALQSFLGSEDDEVRCLAARSVGIISQYVSDAVFTNLLQSLVASGPSQPWAVRHGTTTAVASMLRHSSSRIVQTPSLLTVTTFIRVRSKDDKVPVRGSAAKCIGRLFALQLREGPAGSDSLGELMPLLVGLLNDDSSEVRRRALGSVKLVSKENACALVAHTRLLGPPIAECLRDGSSPVRVAAERAAFHLFQLSKGADNLQLAQKYITGLDARRIAKQSEVSDASEDSGGESGHP